jgi:hypothetical protein
VSCPPDTLPSAPLAGAHAFVRRTTREGVRLFFITIGWGLIAAGFVIHPGFLLVALGAVLVLRNSYSARRRFIHLQRRYPRVISPVRRLIRRDPQVWAVLWQQTLRFERMVLPARWRRAGVWRRRHFRAKRVQGAPAPIA